MSSAELIPTKTRNILMLIPLFGILVFVCLYFAATLYYPGGSQANANEKGFSWLNNYWCNLLNDKAMNGQTNAAKPIAVIAMVVLCVTLANFCYIFPKQLQFNKSHRLTVQISGMAAMAIAIFLFTNFHDLVINIASLFAFIAIIGMFVGLYKQKWSGLFWLGTFNILLVVLNNILYYGKGLKLYLPVVQKITFLFFLIWICLIDIKLYNKSSYNNIFSIDLKPSAAGSCSHKI